MQANASCSKKKNKSQHEARKPVVKNISAALVCKLLLVIFSYPTYVRSSRIDLSLFANMPDISRNWMKLLQQNPPHLHFGKLLMPLLYPTSPTWSWGTAAAASPSSSCPSAAHSKSFNDKATPFCITRAVLEGSPAAWHGAQRSRSPWQHKQSQWLQQVRILLPPTGSSANT